MKLPRANLWRQASLPAVEPGFPARRQNRGAGEQHENASASVRMPSLAGRQGCRPLRQAEMPDATTDSRAHDQGGALLIECIMYIALFALLAGLAFTCFYLFWDNSKALRYATDDISAALNSGERWRADVRGATGTITVETIAGGQMLRIPSGTNAILYSFKAGAVQRRLASSDFSEPVLTTVKTSQMLDDARGPVAAWRWELELQSRHKETHLPLIFTFEAAPTKP